MTRQVTLVCGPPCAGKSTYVADHAQPDDLILCVDTLAVEAGSGSEHEHEGQHWRAAEQEYQRRCDRLGRTFAAHAWVLRCAPEPRTRERLAARVGATRVVVLFPTLDVAYRRAMDRGDTTAGDVAGTCRAITSWFRRYRPSPLDEVIPVGELTADV